MDIRDIMGDPTALKRPDHPDFWILSETILGLKASMEDNDGNHVEQERVWRKSYSDLGDFDSIAYHAVQAAFECHGIVTVADWNRLKLMGQQESYVRSVQCYFDGFLMGAQFAIKKGLGS